MTIKHRFEFALPLVLGVYFLIQGGALAINAEPLVRLAGLGVLIWVPGCAYYSWRGYAAWRRQRLPVEPAEAREPEQAHSQAAA